MEASALDCVASARWPRHAARGSSGDLRERCPGIDTIVRVAVTPEVIERFNLPEMPGKETDSRSAAFRARHGKLVQVEVEALDPADLRDLFTAAVRPLVDESILEAVLARGAAERAELSR